MLLASIGDVLTIRKHYQKTFKLNSDESANDNILTCLDINKLKEVLGEYDAEEPLTAPLMLAAIEESIVEVPMDESDNFYMEINDPTGSGSSNMGYSGKDKYDSFNYYEPESLTDERKYNNPLVSVPKSKKKSTNTETNKKRITSTGREASVN